MPIKPDDVLLSKGAIIERCIWRIHEESTYEQCLAHELSLNGIKFKVQHPLPVEYKGIRLDCGYRIDVSVESEIILELKSVDELKGIHEAQLLTYMKLAGIKQGFLINFNVRVL